METLTAVLQMVTNLGFPVVMCLLIFKQNADLSTKFESLVQNTTQVMTQTTAAVSELTRCIENLTEEVEDLGNRK